MKKIKTVGVGIACALVLAVGFFKPSAAQAEGSASPQMTDAREIWQSVSLTATVEAINHKTRVATLRVGEDVTVVTVDKQVKRLDEVTVGDKVKVEYYVSLATEIRQPTAEEQKMPLTVLQAGARAPLDMPPGASEINQVRAVATIEGIDRCAERVTLKGPGGNSVTVHPLDPSRLDKVRLGDTVIVTYTESLAIYVEEIQ